MYRFYSFYVDLLVTVTICKTNARNIECKFSISVSSHSKLQQQRLFHHHHHHQKKKNKKEKNAKLKKKKKKK